MGFGRNGGMSLTAYGFDDFVEVVLETAALREEEDAERSLEEGGGEARGERGKEAVAVVAIFDYTSCAGLSWEME